VHPRGEPCVDALPEIDDGTVPGAERGTRTPRCGSSIQFDAGEAARRGPARIDAGRAGARNVGSGAPGCGSSIPPARAPTRPQRRKRGYQGSNSASWARRTALLASEVSVRRR
jgi:hypothetical protein